MKQNTKWISILLEVEKSIPTIETIEDYKILLSRFESIDIEHRDQYYPQLYLKMWKVAIKAGRLNLAHSYAKKSFDYLINYKRIPEIKLLIKSLKEEGLFNKKYEEYYVVLDILQGKQSEITNESCKKIDLYINHPDHWKYSFEFLVQSLLLDEEWSIDQWKRCYEFILVHKFNKEIFLLLSNKADEYKNKKAKINFVNYLKTKKIRTRVYLESNEELQKEKQSDLHIDYDQIAMDVISGAISSINEEEKRVINSLKFISDDELLIKGQEMIVAFELLGMEHVVLLLCERMVKSITDVKELAKTYYVWAQALKNSGEYYKCIDLIDDVLSKVPLLQDEQLAFVYIKAEACLKLKKIKMAKELYLEIKKINPHYRLVSERLRAIETN